MKYEIYLMLVVFLALSFASLAGEVEVGASKEDVIAALGKPRGMIASGDYELLDYERGRIELQDGEVVSVELMTPRELAAAKDEEARRKAQRLRLQEQMRKERHRRGLQLKDELFESVKFEHAAGSEKLQILHKFHKKYPDVDIDSYLISALAEKEAEDARQAKEERIARLEKRVEDAERKAQQAKWQASAAAVDAQDALRTRYYRRRYYTDHQPISRPRNFGLSVGYESPEFRIKYSNGHRTIYKKHRTGTHAVSGDRIRKTSSTVRFNDGW